MKKLFKLSFIIIIPLIIGFVLIFTGVALNNESVLNAGYVFVSAVVPACIFILAVVGIVILMTGKLHGKSHVEAGDERSAEREDKAREEMEEIAEINESYGYESQIKSAEYHIRKISENYSKSSSKQKFLGWLLFAFLITDFALILVFSFLGITVGIIICFCLFIGTIGIAFIIKVILEKLSINGSKKRTGSSEILEGIVKSCVLSSTSSVGGSRTYSTTRISNVTYRITVTVGGKDYNAYSEKFYEEGQSVKITVIIGNLVSIIE